MRILSLRGIVSAMPNRASGYICADVSTFGGYTYFGIVTVFCFLFLSFAALTAAYSSGTVRALISCGSMFVTNEVGTTAPFSYVISTPVGIAVQ